MLHSVCFPVGPDVQISSTACRDEKWGHGAQAGQAQGGGTPSLPFPSYTSFDTKLISGTNSSQALCSRTSAVLGPLACGKTHPSSAPHTQIPASVLK